MLVSAWCCDAVQLYNCYCNCDKWGISSHDGAYTPYALQMCRHMHSSSTACSGGQRTSSSATTGTADVARTSTSHCGNTPAKPLSSMSNVRLTCCTHVA